jgi:hypothetical protein
MIMALSKAAKKAVVAARALHKGKGKLKPPTKKGAPPAKGAYKK